MKTEYAPESRYARLLVTVAALLTGMGAGALISIATAMGAVNLVIVGALYVYVRRRRAADLRPAVA